ncbi:MAG TPA: signal peptidase I [Candidatus Saccharimonadia bacterium]
MRLARCLKIVITSLYVMCALALVVFMLPFSGLSARTVITGSMAPAIPTGSLVIIQSVPPGDIQVGDIVTYKDPRNLRRTITHRVIKCETQAGITFFTTKGDANSQPDPRIASGAVVGQVRWHVPYVGHVVELIKTPYGLALLVVIPGLWVIWDEGRRLRRALQQPKPAPPPAAKPAAPPAAESALPPARPPVAPATQLQVQRRRPPRTIRLGLFFGLVAALALSTHHTYGLYRTNAVTVQNYNLSVRRPTPTPAPTPAPTPLPSTLPPTKTTPEPATQAL